MLCAWPGGEVVAALGDQLKREVWAEAVDLRQAFAEQGASLLGRPTWRGP